MPIRVKLDRLMKLRDCATWDGGKTTWGGRVEAMGTVPLKAGVRGRVFGRKNGSYGCCPQNFFGNSWTLKDVRYILGLKRRLIFVGQLDEEGYHVGFGDQQWKVTKGSLVVARGNKRGSLYMVKVPFDGINATIDGRGNATLWHRGGHMSEKVKILATKGRIPDLQKAIVGFCEPCVLGKQKKADLATMLPLSMTTAGSREFIEYCAENGIRMMKTVLETPQ
uniref:Retrovirus-related Pol polyprotein from transposon TNT 1-94 n=1 Tax=Tanacetum cinerariifolium TaxID=118510 RepID=A0A6L2NVR8_TANCI|nr:retrovirus-related Pol polyprotein from transposon TNT 1-94 [Tanacetum cinerariifolium]